MAIPSKIKFMRNILMLLSAVVLLISIGCVMLVKDNALIRDIAIGAGAISLVYFVMKILKLKRLDQK